MPVLVECQSCKNKNKHSFQKNSRKFGMNRLMRLKPASPPSMTAEQAAFYLRLAEFKAIKDPSINFSVLVAEQQEKELQHLKRYYN
jgi:hypothetical protein